MIRAALNRASRPKTAIPNRLCAVNHGPTAGAYTASGTRQLRWFVIAEMAFSGGLSPGTLEDAGSFARRSGQRHQFFQLQAATFRAGQNRGRSDQQFESFVAIVATVIVDWHISPCWLAYKTAHQSCASKKNAYGCLSIVNFPYCQVRTWQAC